MTCFGGRLFLVALCGAALAQEPAKPRLTARELFYNAQAGAVPAQQPAAAKPVAQAKPPAQAKPKTQVAKAKPAPAAAGAPATTMAASEAPALPGGARIVQASTAAAAPLGLKYSILKSAGDGSDMAEAPVSTVFHSGDHIRFNVETNSTGFLYIFTQGSSGTWQVLFPSAAVEGGSNRVDGFHSYTMPPGHRFTFDEQAGTEKIFLVLSRTPVEDLENLMYSLKDGAARPAADPVKPKPEAKTLVASVTIDDSTVGRLRQAYSRDLVIEKVDETTPGERKENAVYVVNPKGAADSRVVADLLLVHQ